MALVPYEEGALYLVKLRFEGPEVSHKRLVLAAGSLARWREILPPDQDHSEESSRSSSSRVQRSWPSGSSHDAPDVVNRLQLHGLRGPPPQSTREARVPETAASSLAAPLTQALVVTMSRSPLAHPTGAPHEASFPWAESGMYLAVAASILDALKGEYGYAAERRGYDGNGDFIGPGVAVGSPAVGDKVIVQVGETRETACCMTQSDHRSWKDDDLCTLPELFDASGDRKRSFASGIEHMQFELEGRIVFAWILRNPRSKGGLAFAAQGFRVAPSSFASRARPFYESEASANIDVYAVEAGQLRVLTSITVELILRRQFLIRESGRSLSLMRHVVYLLRDDAAVAEENRKALEEMRLSKRGGEGRNKGKGEDDKAGAAAGAEGL